MSEYRRRFTPDETAKVIALYGTGMSIRAIADEIGRSPSGVRNELWRNRIPRRPRGGYRRKTP
ncbi:MAG: Helix-turn-helix domain [Thermomicrobiales bacterium]|nr:Helix-turn-helix domain [Thermomicrobiales bacterium]